MKAARKYESSSVFMIEGQRTMEIEEGCERAHTMTTMVPVLDSVALHQGLGAMVVTTGFIATACNP
jgi:hypothetical protein